MSAPTLANVLTDVLTSITTILDSVATTIADNADVIATVIVVGALALVTLRYGTRIMNGVSGWFRGIF